MSPFQAGGAGLLGPLLKRGNGETGEKKKAWEERRLPWERCVGPDRAEQGYWGNILRTEPWVCALSPHSTSRHPQVSSINRVLRALQEDHQLPWAQLRSPGGSWSCKHKHLTGMIGANISTLQFAKPFLVLSWITLTPDKTLRRAWQGVLLSLGRIELKLREGKWLTQGYQLVVGWSWSRT